jgi:hypothetical protein
MAISAGIFYEYVMYSRRIANAKYEKYDFSTCTAGDYTMRIDIPADWFKTFNQKNENRRESGKKVRDIEMFLQKVIVDRLNEFGPENGGALMLHCNEIPERDDPQFLNEEGEFDED